MSKKTLPVLALLCSALVLSGAAQAGEAQSMPGTLTGSVSMNSDYVSRGISQTANGAALMGSVDWSFKTGYRNMDAYVGAFAANVDFPGSGANLKTDFLAGLRGTFAKIDTDIGFAYYKYHGASSSLNMDYYEIIARAARDFGAAKISGQVNYSPDYSGKTGNGVYAAARVDAPLPAQFGGFVTVGHQWIENNTLATLPDYTDWSVGFTRQLWKFNVTAMYTDTNLSKGDCYARAYGNVCGARGVVSVGLPF